MCVAQSLVLVPPEPVVEVEKTVKEGEVVQGEVDIQRTTGVASTTHSCRRRGLALGQVPSPGLATEVEGGSRHPTRGANDSTCGSWGPSGAVAPARHDPGTRQEAPPLQ